MIGLDISSTQYLEMTYFIDSLITDCEARLVYYDQQLSSLGVDLKKLDDPSFVSSDYFNPSSVDYFLELRKKDKDVMEKLYGLKRYYLNLLSISEFTLYNASDKNNDIDELNVPGKNLKKLKLRELERSKFSSDLHDSSIQLLTGLVHKCELISRLMDFDVTRSRMELSSVISDLKNAISDLRGFIFNLRAPSLTDFSLVESIEDYCNYKNKDRKVKVVIKTVGEEGDLSPVSKSNLYRICQEAFNNVLSHSDGDRADIIITYNENNVVLTVKDNGSGFDESLLSDDRLGKKNFGLLIMKERAEIIGGSFEIKSVDHCTEVNVSVPKTPEDII
ncbi:MAG: sensor histidine kinase [Lachnospiraceae bacterium]|nr:sensor histidine kinase [Lachnospiraceae bacterium]